MATDDAGVHPRSSQARQPQVICQSNDVVEPRCHIRSAVALSIATSRPRPASCLKLRPTDPARQVPA